MSRDNYPMHNPTPAPAPIYLAPFDPLYIYIFTDYACKADDANDWAMQRSLSLRLVMPTSP
jgi:hypothetical protein